MKSAAQFLCLSIIVMIGLVGAAVSALIWNRLEAAAIALGLVLILGGSWCATQSRKPTRATVKATLFCAMALGGLLILAAVTDLFDFSPSDYPWDLTSGAHLGALLCAIAACFFAHFALGGTPRVALYLVAGWTAFAVLIMVLTTQPPTGPFEPTDSPAPLAVIPGLIWLFLQDRRRHLHGTLSSFEAAVLVATVAGFAISLSSMDTLSRIESTSYRPAWQLDSLSLGAALCAWLWVGRVWLLRRGCAQAAALLAGAAWLLVLQPGMSFLISLFIAWAAWRQASHGRSSAVDIALFALTALLLLLGLQSKTMIAVLGLAGVLATCALCQTRWSLNSASGKFRLGPTKALGSAGYLVVAFVYPVLLITAAALIHWLETNVSPSRVMAQLNLPTKWIVAQALRDDYLWPRSVRASWLTHNTADAILADARVDTPDVWSGIEGPNSVEDFDWGSELSSKVDWVRGRGRTFAGYVQEGSPAHAAGIRRGFELIKLDCAESSSQQHAQARARSLADCKGGVVRGVFRDDAGSNREITWTLSREASDVWHTILETKRGPVGYLLLRAFRSAASQPLTDAIRTFEQAKVRDVVVDLRYNGGGSLSVATQLASLLGGERLEWRLLWTLTHNRYNADLNHEIRFPLDSSSKLALKRIAFLTGPQTCSASESVIVGLSPHLPVITIGQGTCGKPVGFTPIDTADSDVWLIDFELKNAKGVGHYFKGILPDCHIVEDLRAPLGDPNEKLLASALAYFDTGKCSRTEDVPNRPSVGH